MPKSWRWPSIALAAVIALFVLAAFLVNPLLARIARRDLVKALGEASSSDVTIQKVSVSLLPPVRITAEGVVFRYGGRTDTPPIAVIAKMVLSASPLGLFSHPRQLRRVTLDGMAVVIPPDRNQGKARPRSSGQSTGIGELAVTNSRLQVLPSNPEGEAFVLPIHLVHLQPVRENQVVHYIVDVDNAKPPGPVHLSGEFGPLQGRDPGAVPISGSYRFDKADLSVFHDLGGSLSSTANFRGRLDAIEVAGTVDVPDFLLRIGQHPVHVQGEFQATVNGTTGNTALHPVTAHFLHTTLVATGAVESKPGEHGKTVKLDTTVAHGRIDDFVWLATDSREPFITGPVTIHTTVVYPPGQQPFLDKVRVRGTLTIGSAQYNRPRMQQAVDRLSERAEGDPKGPAEVVTSEIRGEYSLYDAVAHVSTMLFHVPGATAHVSGTYGVKTHALNFKGSLRTEAKASEMTTGWKSALLKVVDPLLKRKHAGAEVPIKVTGTREHPSIGVRKVP